MPVPLLHRCQPNNIFEFRAAAFERASDGVRLLEVGRRTAAIYLFGYAIEMTLKAAYFKLLGFADTQPITRNDFRSAILSARTLGVAWRGNLHDLPAWAELIVVTRGARPGCAYAVPRFGDTVVSMARRAHSLWREALRYHRNVAYAYEVEQVLTATKWMLANTQRL